MISAVVAACSESNLTQRDPLLEAPATIDFGEVVVGNQSTIAVGLENAGYGSIVFSEVSLDPLSSADFAVSSWPDGEIGHDEVGELWTNYTPDAEGGDIGMVRLQMEIEDSEPVEIALEGVGVRPCIDIDPETLFFGTVTPGESVTLPTRIGVSCTGSLKISHLDFAGDEAVAYSYALPADWAEPYTLAHGEYFTLDVTFTPPDAAEYSGRIDIASNDPEQPSAAVTLVGNSEDDPTSNEPPVVEILDPDNGQYFLDDEVITFVGSVYDADQDVEELICWWDPGDSATPSSAGEVDGSATLEAGDITLTLSCIDDEDEIGRDSVAFTVWPNDEPLMYTLSGGDTIFDYFAVDDDLSLALNGSAIYADVDGTKTTLPPIEFEAQRGDVLTVTAVDQNYCEAVLEPLVLHWGTGDRQDLTDGVCLSACEDGACNDGTYNGPWPGVFFEDDFTIAIP